MAEAPLTLGTAAFLLVVMGAGSVVMAAAMRAIGRRPPLPMNPKATELQAKEAQRATREIDTIIVPWMYRLGVAAIVLGSALALVSLAR